MSRNVIHQDDCLGILLNWQDEPFDNWQDETFDLVFADPPFNANKEYADGVNDNLPVAEYREWLQERLEAIVGVMKDGASLWLMNDTRHIGACQVMLDNLGLTFHNMVVWAYTNPTPAGNGNLAKTWRPILYYTKGPKPAIFDSEADALGPATLYHNPDRAKSHPVHDLWPDIPKLVGGFLAPPELMRKEDRTFAHLAQMPEAIARRILLLATKAGDRVLDPFAGSGTFLAVAAKMGRIATGIELSATYCDLIRKRLGLGYQRPLEVTP